MKKLFLLIIMVFTFLFAYGQKFELSSPDGKLKTGIEINKGINVTLNKGDKTVIKFGIFPLKQEIKHH